MLPTRRLAVTLLSRPQRCQWRAYAESSHTEGSHGSASSHHHHKQHSAPANESLGRGFYITLGSIVSALALYKYSLSDVEDRSLAGDDIAKLPLVTRFLRYFDDLGEQNRQINTLHVATLEKAGRDRNMFENERPSRVVDLRFPEVFNTGSPFNVPAGHQANLSALYDHYRKKDKEMEEERKARQEWSESYDARKAKDAQGGLFGTYGRR